MSKRSYQLLFRLFSFLADQTNGFPLFVKYKLVLGSFIIGLTGTSCTEKKQALPENRLPDSLNKEIRKKPLDTLNSIHDTVPSVVKTSNTKNPPPISLPPEIPMVSEPITCYMPIAPEPNVPYYLVAETDSILELDYATVEIKPQSPFGELGDFIQWVEKNIHYPAICNHADFNGRVFARFIIDESGTLTNITILRSFDAYFSGEVERILASSPAWKPATHRNEPVKVIITIPIKIDPSLP